MELLAAIDFKVDTVRVSVGFNVVFLTIERSGVSRESYSVDRRQELIITQMKGKIVLGALDAKGD
jgi:hypothetical protein